MKHRLMILILLLAWVTHIHADNKIKVSDVTITLGGTGCIVIDLDNSDVFTAFTMKLTLPNGISYVSFEKNDNRFSDHNVWDGVKNGQKMFGCLSGTNSAIIGNNGTLLTVNFSADESLNTGTELTATLSEITFATTSLTEQVLEDVNIKMTIKAKPKVTANKYTLTYKVDEETYKTFDVEYGTDITAEVEPTKEGYTFSGWSLIPETMPAHDVIVTGYFTLIDAIEDVIADDGEYQIYSLDGKPIETLQKGVNIIRFSNGTTKSVYVK